MTIRDTLAEHFDKVLELAILVFIFVFATVMLAMFPGREEMARWIENGAVIAILARAFGTQKTTQTTEITTGTKETNTESKPQEPQP